MLLDAINGVQSMTKAPIPLIAASALGAAATACQGIADVLRPTLPSPTPLSLNLLTIAESGERKSAVDGFFFAPIHDFEVAQRTAHQDKSEAYQMDSAVRKAKEAGLLDRIKKRTQKGQSVEPIEQELRDLHRSRSMQPVHQRIVLSDITRSALLAGLANTPCTAVLHASEAADVIRGQAMRDLPLLNKLWDGQTVEVDRSDKTRNLHIENARLSSVLAVQPDTFKFLCEGRDGHARNSG
jgi:hypothetical protein